MIDLIGKRITPIPVLKSVFEGKVFYRVMDGTLRPSVALPVEV
jgi:hypothetical protein